MYYFHHFILVFVLLFISCSKQNQDISENIFRYNEASSITSLDPVFSNNQANIWATNQIFNTLIELDSNLILKPSIAKEWTISNNGLKYSFILRDDV